VGSIIAIILFFIIAAICVGMIVLTLSLNTKSDGLGAAITGSAGDSYRGVVGVEEKKRLLLQRLGYTFLAITFLFSIIYRFFFGG
jgi:preprotein translocase subunit SecG